MWSVYIRIILHCNGHGHTRPSIRIGIMVIIIIIIITVRIPNNIEVLGVLRLFFSFFLTLTRSRVRSCKLDVMNYSTVSDFNLLFSTKSKCYDFFHDLWRTRQHRFWYGTTCYTWSSINHTPRLTLQVLLYYYTTLKLL